MKQFFKKIQSKNFQNSFWQIFLAGNIIIGFVTFFIRILIHTSDLELVLPIPLYFNLVYLIASTAFLYYKSKNLVRYRMAYLISFVLCCLILFVLIGIVSPMSFVGWYFARGFYYGIWDLTFLMQIMEVTYG